MWYKQVRGFKEAQCQGRNTICVYLLFLQCLCDQKTKNFRILFFLDVHIQAVMQPCWTCYETLHSHCVYVCPHILCMYVLTLLLSLHTVSNLFSRVCYIKQTFVCLGDDSVPGR